MKTGILGVCVGSLSFAVSASASTLEKQQVRDWDIYCKDNRYCIASTTGRSDSGETMRFKLERGNKENSIIYVTTAPKGPKLALGMKVTIAAAGSDTRFSGTIKKVYDNNEMAFKEKTSSELIALLKEGRFGSVSVVFGGSTGTVTYEVSLQGVTSALAYMDVVQGRLDRADAAVIIGGEAFTSKSSYDFRAAKAPPEAHENDEKEVAAVRDPEEAIDEGDEESGLNEAQFTHNKSDIPNPALSFGYQQLNCDLPFAIEAVGAQSINLDPGRFLYLIPCTGADLNFPFYAVLQDAGEFQLLDFQEAASETGARVKLVSNLRWDPSNKGIEMYEYYSPEQDCGKHERHSFAPQEGRFYLSEARIKENCDGVVTPPEKYPLSWNGEGD